MTKYFLFWVLLLFLLAFVTGVVDDFMTGVLSELTGWDIRFDLAWGIIAACFMEFHRRAKE